MFINKCLDKAYGLNTNKKKTNTINSVDEYLAKEQTRSIRESSRDSLIVNGKRRSLKESVEDTDCTYEYDVKFPAELVDMIDNGYTSYEKVEQAIQNFLNYGGKISSGMTDSWAEGQLAITNLCKEDFDICTTEIPELLNKFIVTESNAMADEFSYDDEVE